jgi:hypothetical protein
MRTPGVKALAPLARLDSTTVHRHPAGGRMGAWRGLVWIGVGAIVVGIGLATGRPWVIRGTRIPWGLIVIGAGAILLAWDTWKKRSKPRE